MAKRVEIACSGAGTSEPYPSTHVNARGTNFDRASARTICVGQSLLHGLPKIEKVSWRNLTLLMALATSVLVDAQADAQSTNVQIYALVTGSQIVDDCPICGRPTIVLPLTGTFTLSILDQNTLSTRYKLTGISFKAGGQPGNEYKVIGSGLFQIGGEVALLQNLFLDVEIDTGSATTKALCVSTNRTVSKRWPEMQISVDQTNGTPAQVYHLTLNAVPVPIVNSFAPDPHTGTIRLQWDASGGSFQVEWAPSIGGPFTKVTTITTNSSFTDVGVLTNFPQVFYRVHRF